jgi:hypothetical protein
MFTTPNKWTISDHRAPVLLDGHISYGQSWRSNSFPDFGSFDLNPEAPLALMVSSMGAFLGPGPLSNGAGINLTALPVGTTNYAPSDWFAIGRSAILALQLLRIRDGVTALPPTLEMCTAFPGSTWNSGLGGGLAPGAWFSGSISGTTLTVDSMTKGYVAGGQTLVAAGVHPMTRIYSNLTLARDVDTESLLADNPDSNSPGLLVGLAPICRHCRRPWRPRRCRARARAGPIC